MRPVSEKDKCFQCGDKAVPFHGRPHLCRMHYRIRAMRATAKYRGLKVPSVSELEVLWGNMVTSGMKCQCCGKTMLQDGTVKRPLTASLQHDRSGAFRLICVTCNKRHWAYEGDSFYDLPETHKKCWRCKSVKHLDEFGKNRRLMNGIQGYCKLCAREMNGKRLVKNGYRARRGIKK